MGATTLGAEPVSHGARQFAAFELPRAISMGIVFDKLELGRRKTARAGFRLPCGNQTVCRNRNYK